MVAQAIGSWNFSAHDLTEDELLHAASLMLQHALAMPALEQWRITMSTATASQHILRFESGQTDRVSSECR